MTLEYDVVVVGGGNAGLSAAATTAKEGLKTLLLERHSIPGGCASSFRRGRFEFEPSLHELAGYGTAEAPGDARMLFADLGIDAEMIPVDYAFRTIITGPDGYDIIMPTGVENFIKKMEEEAPGSLESMANFFKLTGEVGRGMMYLASGKPDPQVLMTEHLNFMKVANQPLGVVLDELNMPKKTQQILCTYWSYLNAPRDEAPFIHYALMVYRYLSMKAFIPKYRSHELSLSFVERIRDYGGDVWLNTEVEKFLIRDGVCYGVQTKDGLEIHAKHVISNITPHRVFGSMVDKSEVPEQELKRANAREIGCSGLVVFLGLDKSAEELGIEDYTIFISSTPDSNEQYKGRLSLYGNNMVIANCLNTDNPGCSPEGTCILWLTLGFSVDAWNDVTLEDYKAIKNKLAKDAIDQYEAATGVKISDCIEEIAIATPATFARYLSTPGGSIYGYAVTGFDSMLSRIMTARDENWIKGLSFCGGHGTRTIGYTPTYVNGNQTGLAVANEIKGGE